MKRKFIKTLIITTLVSAVTINYLTPVVYANEIVESQNSNNNIIQEENQSTPVEEVIVDKEVVVPDIITGNEVKEETIPNSEVKEEIKTEVQEPIKEEVKSEVKDAVEKDSTTKSEYIPLEAWENNQKLMEEVTSKTGIEDISKVTYEDIKQIKMLDIAYKVDSNKIPEIVGKFEGLVVLYLNDNLEVKELPTFICNLPNLKELDISNMGITDLPKEFANLKNLEFLNISWNPFEAKSIPEEVLQLRNLKYLEAYRANINRIPKEIGNLKELISLNLSFSYISSISEELYTLSNLRYLGLNSTSMTEIPVDIFQMTNLEELDLMANNIIEIPDEIINMKGDKLPFTLNVSVNQIAKLPKTTGRQNIICEKNFVPATLYNIPGNVSVANEIKLKAKTLKINKGEILTEEKLREYVKGVTFSKYQVYDMPEIDKRHKIEIVLDNKVVTPEEIANLEEGSYKVRLKLAKADMDNPNAITSDKLEILIGNAESKPDEGVIAPDPDIPEDATGKIPVEYWQNCKSLMIYVCLRLGIKDIREVTYEDLKEIKDVYLVGTELDNLPKIIEKFTSAEGICLNGNRFAEVPEELFKLDNLKVLWLGENNFTEVPASLGKLKSLEQLYFYDNNLSGNKIDNLKLIKNLTGVSLMNCNLTDVSALKECTKLERSAVHDNQLVKLPNIKGEIYYDGNFIPQDSEWGYSKQLYIGKGMELEFNKGDKFDSSLLESCVTGRYIDPSTGEGKEEKINSNHKFEFVVNNKVVSLEDITNMNPGTYNIKVKLVGSNLNNKNAIAENTIKITIKGDGTADVNKPVVKPPVNENINKLPYTGGIPAMATMLFGTSLIGTGLVVGKKKKK